MFFYMDDWKNLPMAAVIAGLVAYVAGKNMFVSMEGAAMGSLALSCICIWNGFFNSIQSVCRERDVVKREHRSGMHISSYLIAHMIYQAFMCLCQTLITVYVCKFAGMNFPTLGFVTGNFELDFGITIFLLTYSADMISLAISCMAKTTTTAMTLMPFMLIFELLFSGNMFKLDEAMSGFTDLSIAKWGINCMSAQAGYNSLPMVTVWNQMVKFQNYTYEGVQPLKYVVQQIYENNQVDEFCLEVGRNSQVAEYVQSYGNILNCWFTLIMFAIIAAFVAVLILERIDKDKR